MNGKLETKSEEEIDKDRKEPTDKLTMDIIKEVADSVEEMIDTEADYPSAEKNYGKILDMKVWVRKW